MKDKEPSSCVRCSSKNVEKFSAEMNIHFPGHEGLSEPTVWVFSQLTVCLNCGWAEFSIPEAELQRLADCWQRIRPKAA